MTFDIHTSLSVDTPTDWTGDSFDSLDEATAFADEFAASAREDEYPLVVIAVINSDLEIVYRTSAVD